MTTAQTTATEPTSRHLSDADLGLDAIRDLRTEAATAGESEQVALCDRALDGDQDALAECYRVIGAAAAVAEPAAHTPLDLSVDCTGDDPGATWWECPECGDYAWLAPGQEPPECSCEGDPDTLPAAGRDADAWWAWHDADPSRHSPGETPTEGTEAAERRCAAWLRGESTDGPES